MSIRLKWKSKNSHVKKTCNSCEKRSKWQYAAITPYVMFPSTIVQIKTLGYCIKKKSPSSFGWRCKMPKPQKEILTLEAFLLLAIAIVTTSVFDSFNQGNWSMMQLGAVMNILLLIAARDVWKTPWLKPHNKNSWATEVKVAGSILRTDTRHPKDDANGVICRR